MRKPTLIVVVLALGYLTGCGGSDDTTTQSTTAVMTTTPATTSASTSTSTSSDGGTQTTQTGSGDGAIAPVLAAAAVLTSHATPEKACVTYVTEHFVATAYGGEQNCLAARKDQPLASKITVDQSAENTTSHLVVIPDGGPYDGAQVEVEIVEVDGKYQVDGLTAHVPAGP
jgi:hypothetical protein